MDPTIWGPHYWAVLHTIAISYPDHPDAIQKKVVYRFVNNLPALMPPGEWTSNFKRLLDKYPVAPYLDQKNDFVRWTNMIHNKVNESLNKPLTSLDQMIAEHIHRYAAAPYQLSMIQWNKTIAITAGCVAVLLLIGAIVIEHEQ